MHESVEESTVKFVPQERLVLAVDAETRTQLLPQFGTGRFASLAHAWADIATLEADEWESFLRDARPTILLTGWGTPRVPERVVHDRQFPLRYICHLTGSVRRIVPRALIERGTIVSNWGNTISFCIAEHAMLLVLGALRNLPAWADGMAQWPRRTVPSHLPIKTRSLRGKRVGLHGFGSIARELVHMLRPFGVALAAYSSGVPTSLFERYDVRCCGSLEELFSDSDVLIECEALTPLSKGSVDAGILDCLRAGAVFVNVGRGDVVDEVALTRIAAEKQLRLGLDVYHEEPLPAHSLLHEYPNALLSPHIAGPTWDTLGTLHEFALANIGRYLRGEKVEAEVTLDVYDRST